MDRDRRLQASVHVYVTNNIYLHTCTTTVVSLYPSYHGMVPVNSPVTRTGIDASISTHKELKTLPMVPYCTWYQYGTSYTSYQVPGSLFTARTSAFPQCD